MGKLFRAATGFMLALWLLHGEAPWVHWGTPGVLALKADIAVRHPGARLAQELNAGLEGLMTRDGTAPAPVRRSGAAHF